MSTLRWEQPPDPSRVTMPFTLTGMDLTQTINGSYRWKITVGGTYYTKKQADRAVRDFITRMELK